jgi:hypothetical protein
MFTDMFCSFENFSELSIIQGNGGGKITDNPKPQLKQKQLKHSTKWF